MPLAGLNRNSHNTPATAGVDAYRTQPEIETEEETPTPEPTGEPVTAS